MMPNLALLDLHIISYVYLHMYDARNRIVCIGDRELTNWNRDQFDWSTRLAALMC